MRLPVFLAGLALFAVAPAAADECRLCAPRKAERQERAQRPASLEVETSLDFDRVLLINESGGTARIGADGSRSSSGGVAALSERSMVGSVTIRGEPGRSLRIELPNRIDLFALNGSRLTLTRVTTDLAPNPKLDGRGELSFHFGGELDVSGNAEGDYRGEVPITVEYF